MEILVNQLGYETTRPKRAVIQGAEAVDAVAVVERATDTEIYRATADRVGSVANWDRGPYWTVDFSGVAGTGEFALRGTLDGETHRSRAFRIADRVCQEQLASALLWYFRTRRPAGADDRADRAVPFVGDRSDAVDVRGGWYDAAADAGKYLARAQDPPWLTAQRIPLVAWGLLDGLECLADRNPALAADLGHRIRAEARHGADFLARACDEAGYFYVAVHDGLSHDPDRRRICGVAPDGSRTANYQASFRTGGGLAVAALARASQLAEGGAVGTGTYRATAVRAFEHLREHETDSAGDGTQTVVGDCCALLAATELADATGQDRFRAAATEHARALLDCRRGDERFDGCLWTGEPGGPPFVHPADEGLPAVALHRYRTALDVPIGDAVDDALARYWRFQVAIADDGANPFGYPRQYVGDGESAVRFFMPESRWPAPRWRGENARLASLATAAFRSREVLGDPALEARLTDLGHRAVDWLLGCNPFDRSMVQGVGNDPPDYHPEHRNAPGGVVNGVTAAPGDPGGIAFCPDPHASDLAERWRWTEQSLSNAIWLLVALCSTDRI